MHARIRSLLASLALGASLAPLPVAAAQPGGTTLGELRQRAADRSAAASIERRAIAAFEVGKHAEAERLLLRQIELDPTSFVAHYNLACVRSVSGDVPGAEEALSKAIGYGFDDVHQLRRDPSLATLRDEGTAYQELLDAWPRILDARRDAVRASVDSWLSGRTETRRDDRLRIDIVSAHDPVATDQARAELALIADWARDALFPDLYDAPWHDHDPWTAVVLPTPDDFRKWATFALGLPPTGAFSTIGGAYDHDRKTLVAQDLGGTLRHEFMHVLHWRDMTRRGQRHAIWIQEGICALVEDYDVVGGVLTPVPSWRTNMVRRMAERNLLPPIAELARKSQRQFSRTRPLAQYAHARCIFLFLLQRDGLSAFYRAYVETYERDPTGIDALERALGVPIAQIDAQYAAWAKALPMVPETGSDLDATLGVDVENGRGDGPVVVGLDVGARARTGLSRGSVITHVEGRPTRDLKELIRVLGDYAPGDTVTLSHRRSRRHTESEATLMPSD